MPRPVAIPPRAAPPGGDGRAAHAAVVAAAGAGNLLSHPAQRVYREALAFSVLGTLAPIGVVRSAIRVVRVRRFQHAPVMPEFIAEYKTR